MKIVLLQGKRKEIEKRTPKRRDRGERGESDSAHTDDRSKKVER